MFKILKQTLNKGLNVLSHWPHLKSWKVKYKWYKPKIALPDVVYWTVLTWKETLNSEHILETETQFIRKLPRLLYILITWESEGVLKFVITASKMQYSWHFLHYSVLECYRVTLNEVMSIAWLSRSFLAHDFHWHEASINREAVQDITNCTKWRWLQTISGTDDVWQERISEKFRQPITRSNLDYVFMQMYNGFQMCILQFFIYWSWYLFTAYLLITDLIKHWDIMLHTSY